MMAALTSLPTDVVREDAAPRYLGQDEFIKARAQWFTEPDMSDQYEAQRRLMKLVGYVPARRPLWKWSFRQCPMWVLGKKCPEELILEGKAVRGRTTCDPRAHRHVHNPDVLDHARLWRHEHTGRVVLTAHPFVLSGDPFSSFIADMNALGLSVTVSGASAYFPTNSVLVLVEKFGTVK